jgi:hypothetical protein
MVLPPLAACTASVVYLIPSAGVHRQTGEQVSGTTRLCDPLRERANQIFRKRSARLLQLFITGRLPSKSGGAAYRRLHRRLLRPVFSNVVINNVTATLRLQANGTCGVLLFSCSSCSASTCFAATCFRSSCCSVHLVCLSYMW